MRLIMENNTNPIYLTVGRSTSSAADCGRPSRDLSGIHSGHGTPSQKSSVAAVTHTSLRRKSMIAACTKEADKWMKEPDSTATETDIIVLER